MTVTLRYGLEARFADAAGMRQQVWMPATDEAAIEFIRDIITRPGFSDLRLVMVAALPEPAQDVWKRVAGGDCY